MKIENSYFLLYYIQGVRKILPDFFIIVIVSSVVSNRDERKSLCTVQMYNAYTHSPTGCSLNIVFFRFFKNISNSGLSLFSLGVSVCTHTRQVEHQSCSRTGRVKNNTKFKDRTQYLMNTLYMSVMSRNSRVK